IQRLFYFSSRRRHTRCLSDWSSDVCSSDLHFDDYDEFMQAGSAGELGRRHGLEQVGFWRKILEHPSYDAFWREQAVDRVLAAQQIGRASWREREEMSDGGGSLRRNSISELN